MPGASDSPENNGLNPEATKGTMNMIVWYCVNNYFSWSLCLKITVNTCLHFVLQKHALLLYIFVTPFLKWFRNV